MLIGLIISFYPSNENSKLVLINNKSELTVTPSITAAPTPYPTYPQFFAIADNTLPDTPNGWVTGDNPVYSIQFPPTWKPSVTGVIGGGTNVVIMPNDTKYFPRFDLEAAPTNPNTPIEKRIEQLKGINPLNYSEIQTSFRGQLATEISEILPIADMKGNPVHKTYIFFTKQNMTYVVTYAYVQDGNADVNNLRLLQILNSITLK